MNLGGNWSEKTGLPEYVFFVVEVRPRTLSYVGVKKKVF